MSVDTYIEKIKNDNLLNTTGPILDVGCGDGRFSLPFAKEGRMVLGIDINANIMPVGQINFNSVCANISTTEITGKYSFIICRNVLPFIKNKEEVREILKKLAQSLEKGGVLYVTLFGNKDEWYGKKTMSFYSSDEAEKIILNLWLSIYHRTIKQGYGKKMDGTMKFWHIYRYILVK